ncbi:MAG: dockerin type I domain-containing protein [Betaproteobacteria bacterium]
MMMKFKMLRQLVLLVQLLAIGCALADPTLLAVQSRKIHGAAGIFDLPITLAPLNGTVTVEPRVLGAGHKLVFQFDTAITGFSGVTVLDHLNGTAVVVSGVSATTIGNEIIVTISTLRDNARIKVQLTGVTDGLGTSDVLVTLGFLVGDINSTSSVNSSDISAIKARSGQSVTAANFRHDVNTSGAINSSDISAVKARSGLSIPMLPASVDVTRTGSGGGVVSSSPVGINCGATCTSEFDQSTTITLTATPDSLSAFTGWSGDCSGTLANTQLVITPGINNTGSHCTASFTALPQFSLTVSLAGAGNGSISSQPAGINCGATCSVNFVQGSNISLTATPSPGSGFTGWSGACSSSSTTTAIVVNANTICTATFAVSGPTDNPIMFVAQVPTLGDFTGRLSTFGNHKTGADEVVRGGDLMIRYQDGTLRNLTKEAGYGVDGAQVDTNPPSSGHNRPIAVREPTVHWSGAKAVFSMLVGAPRQFARPAYFWQVYEVAGLGTTEPVVITKVANQPTIYNNVSPIYGTDDRIIFGSDRPRDGQAHLYPQLDEYESAPTVSGLWSIDPAVAGGDLRMLNHTPSGAFSPSIDSFGRVIFTRWDHMQQDQQADVDRGNPGNPPNGSFNYVNESASSAFDHNNRAEIYPEPRANSTSGLFGGYPVNGYTSNLFTPWQVNEDGTEEETLNHIGRHELSFRFMPPTFRNDPNLSENTDASIRVNRHEVGGDTGLFHMREDPAHPGNYFAIHAREFGSLTSNQIVKFNGPPTTNPEAMAVTDVTAADGSAGAGQPSSPGGRYRNPLPLVSGTLIASHTGAVEPDIATYTPFRLRSLSLNGATGRYSAGPVLTGSGISKSVTWFNPDFPLAYNGLLWEIEAVEVVARARPTRRSPSLPAPESSVFADVGVDPAAFRSWLTTNNLALIVTRNQTKRDRGDLQQPFNLRVPGGVSTVKMGATNLPNGANAYDIVHYQIVQGDLVRGYNGGPTGGVGRRVIAQNLHDPAAVDKNGLYAANPGGPVGSVKIAADGSTAAFVPARRALAWQTTDAAGNAVVRERVWLTVQPGEIRVCASCHGTNTHDQAGGIEPVNPPLALRNLLQAWKAAPTP